MFTLAFWKAALERSISTFVESFLAALLSLGATTLTGVDWLLALNISGLSFVIALLKNILVAKATDGNPSAFNAEVAVGKGRHAAE
jgi:hypothetical protein